MYFICMKKYFSLFITIIILLSGQQSVSAVGSAGNGNTQDYDFSVATCSEQSAQNSIKSATGKIVIDAVSVNLPAATNSGENNSILLREGNPGASFTVNVPEDTIYEMGVCYKSTAAKNNEIKISVLIDGKYPYPEFEGIVLRRIYCDDGGPRVLNNGNEVAPIQKEVYDFFEYKFSDQSGNSVSSMQLKFTAGNHIISLSAKSSEVLIKSIVLTPLSQVSSYNLENSPEKGSSGTIVIEGEKASLKNSKSLVSFCDNSESSLTPANPTLDVMNYIGSSNWSNIGDEITWEFSVEQTGYYSLGYHFRQSYILGGFSYRALKIDGSVPFEEAASIPFKYGSKWQYGIFSDNKAQPYLIYLSEGKHTISLSVTMGRMSEVYSELSDVVLEIGKIYRQIVMITGENPDINRDYNLFSQIPDFESKLNEAKKRLDRISGRISDIAGIKSNSQISVINNMSGTIKRILGHPNQAADYKNNFYSNYGSLGTVLNDMRKLPLDIDNLQLIPQNGSLVKHSEGFIDGICFSAKRFAGSFVREYDALPESKKNRESITIWLNWGRDQAQVLKNLVDTYFVAEKDISVNLKVVNASLIQALLSNNGPDLFLRLSRSYPVDYALRGALYDLTNFKDYNEVMARFMPSAAEPYKFNGGCYALPDTQNFYMMFYRKDIFQELGLSVPSTWNEYIETASILARKNMQVGIPYTQISSITTTDSGIGALNLFPTLLMQFGEDLYAKDHRSTKLSSEMSLKAFEFFTDLYKKYSMPVTYDFYNRFRSGEMPIAIQPYTQYAVISAAAPEIKGVWSMAPIPGFMKDDGTIDNVETGGGTGSVILENSDKKKESWEFLKWWTDAETQARYASNIESLLGSAERQPTANPEALKMMAWDESDMEILIQQWEKVEELPEVPGGYYVSRCVDQAFWTVENSFSNSKTTLLEWGKTADLEIQRKRYEYSLDDLRGGKSEKR